LAAAISFEKQTPDHETRKYKFETSPFIRWGYVDAGTGAVTEAIHLPTTFELGCRRRLFGGFLHIQQPQSQP
jgi:hypothetical protein